ncbi:MAG: peptide chain release factor N(5)-glutamine methyltransferase [Clostridia bacterium]|nr:peptide chain release factor N(5)-glutamine methyltransferase [Clostridia bacterium]
MLVRQWIQKAQEQLRLASCPDADWDAKLLVSGVYDISPGVLFQKLDTELDGETEAKLNGRLMRRIQGEPLQYIEEKAYFMGLEFFVDRRVLIPRQDTETLAEKAVELIKGREEKSVLDLCTGSGAIAVAIAKYCKNARVTATDISSDALEAAKENALKNHADIEFLLGDGFQPTKDRVFDVITCNPPYLTKEDMLNLQREVKMEPALALFGGNDGLQIYRDFSKSLIRHMKNRGYALFEVGEGQAEDVIDIITRDAEYGEKGIIKDLNGIQRVVWVRRS